MSRTTQPRRYDSTRRRAQAAATQREIVRAAHTLFVEHGYAGTTLAAVAEAADVSVPTVYSRFPTKADLLRRTIEIALAGDDEPVAVADRPTAQWVQAADDPREMLRRYAVMCGEVASRAGPIYAVLLVAADTDATLAELLATFEAQRLTAATRIAEAVDARGGLAESADLDDVRDVIWIANAPELYLLAMKRGWPVERYVAYVEGALLPVVTPVSPKRAGSGRARS
jgi:AcrR family transcriptional regulator